MFDLSGMNALVTGASGGLGGAIARALAGQGARVALSGSSEERLRPIATELGGEHFMIPCDLHDPVAVDGLVPATVAAFGGKLDMLVNNVGHFLHSKPFEALSDDEDDAILDINFGQAVRVTRAMLPLLRKAAPGSSIVSITSVEAFRGIPNCAIYGAAKAALTGLTQSLALELAPAGIRVNAVAPETTDTPQIPIDYMIPPRNRAHMDKWIPLGRFGRPQDSANAALYLASDMAAWVTGTTLHVDGGALAAAGWMRTPDGQWTVTPMISGNGIDFSA
jgi:NAD(P)-dependent dehydrogenase (short-subunit alcohol dehydrogenase family)